MNLYTHARKYIDVKDLRRLKEEEIKKRNIAEKKKQQEIILDELKKNEMKTSPKFSNWRRELREFGEWVPISSGPANSATTTFGYFASGEQQVNFETGEPITFTYSGLDGIENYPSTITINQGFGEVHTTNAPPFGQLGVQGYTAKLNPKYKAAQENYKKELKEWKKKEDANFKAIKDTLKSFGTSWEEMRASKKWVKKLGDGTVVAIISTSPNPSPTNWTDNVRIVKLKQAANAPGPMNIIYDPPNSMYDWEVENSEVQDMVYLEIGEQPKAPMESQYLMPRRTDFKDVNPQLDASQEFAQKVDADYMMNARVQDTPEQPSFSKIANNTSVLPTFDGVPRHNPLANLTQLPMGFPYSDAIGNTLRYATGNYDPKVPIKGGQSAALELAVLNSIENEIRSGRIRKDPNRPGYFTVRGDQQSYEGPGGSLTNNYLTNASAQGFLQAYSFKPGKKGVDVKDRFNLTGGRNIGGAAFVSNAINYWLGKFGANASFPNFEQEIVDTLVDIGDNIIRQRGGDPKDDSTAGFDVEFTIPWERIPNNHLLRGKRKKKEEEEVVESTWSKLKKHQKRG